MEFSTVPRLAPQAPLSERLGRALRRADRLDIAVAYVKSSGVRWLEQRLPAESRLVVGTGFAITDPDAVERLAALGANVRVVLDSAELVASTFHPKLYLVEDEARLSVFAGSGNLTAGGLKANVEQYEEIALPIRSALARAHRGRFASAWESGSPLADAQEAGAWERYRTWAAAAREQDRRAATVQRRYGGPVRSTLGAPFEERLPAILAEATGLPVSARRHVHVVLDETIGTRTTQRTGIEIRDGAFELAMWPAELKKQAERFYGDRIARRLVRWVGEHPEWRIAPTPHLGYYHAQRHERVYFSPTIGAPEYARQWEEGDLTRVRNHTLTELRHDLWPWLLRRGYASLADEPELDAFERRLQRRRTDANVRPGMRVWRPWPMDEAAALDDAGELSAAIRACLDALLDALEEPALSDA